MDLTKNKSMPFDIYDFFGYLFPGFVMLIYIGFFWKFAFSENFNAFYNSFFESFFTNNEYETLVTIIILISGIILIYIIGHFVATIGSFWLDRIFLYGTFDTPIYFLLDLKNNERSIYLEQAYRYMFIFFYLILILSLFNEFYVSMWIIYFLIFIMTVFAILRFIVETKWGKKVIDYLKEFKPVKSLVEGKLGSALNVFYNFIRMIVNNNKRFDQNFANDFKENFNKVFPNEYDKISGDDKLWLCYFYISSNNAEHTAHIRTWHQLYGFSRNMASASYLIALVCSIYLIYTQFIYCVNPSEKYIKILLVISTFIGTVFFLRYFNLNQSYYTRNILRSFYVLSKKD